MPRYVAFLRGVSPTNAPMPVLVRCFESAGFTEVCTVRTSGNVVFNATARAVAPLERRIEQAVQAALGRPFAVFVRSAAALRQLLATQPFAQADPAPQAKHIVAFRRQGEQAALPLPMEQGDARIVGQAGHEVFATYRAGEGGPLLMRLLERACGTDITTRTVDTIAKCLQV